MSEIKIPHNEEAEKIVLGAMLVNNELIPYVLGELSADDFHRGGHRIAFRAMAKLSGEQVSVDLVTLKNELVRLGKLDDAGGIAYVASFVDGIPRAYNVEYYTAIVLDRSIARQLLLAMQRVLVECYESSDPASSILDRAQAAVFAITQKQRSRGGLVPIREALYQAIELMARAKAGPMQGGVGYGLLDLDRITGGMQQGELIVLGARPGVGKSAIALHVLASAAKAGKAAALFSLEMGAEQFGLRLLSSQANVDGWGLRTGLAPDLDYDRVAEAVDRLKDLPAWIDDSPTASLPQILSRARRLAAETGLDLVILDYLQLADAPRGANRQEQVSALSRGLKMLAKELKVPVLALSQLSRESEKRSDHRPQLADLRESGSLEQDADTVMLLYDESIYSDRADPNGEVELEIIVAKQRSGPTGTATVLFHKATQAIGDRVYQEEGSAR